nr:MAG TPA: hypothetical protein [Caudoviricetes sp.]
MAIRYNTKSLSAQAKIANFQYTTKSTIIYRSCSIECCCRTKLQGFTGFRLIRDVIQILVFLKRPSCAIYRFY